RTPAAPASAIEGRWGRPAEDRGDFPRDDRGAESISPAAQFFSRLTRSSAGPEHAERRAAAGGRRMNRIVSWSLALSLALSPLFACSGDDDQNASSGSSATMSSGAGSGTGTGAGGATGTNPTNTVIVASANPAVADGEVT